jgi:diguanylate cyclase (GGDEF)-like protein/PAS domain S-box-containing protein
MSEKKSLPQETKVQEYDPDFFHRFADLSYTWESWRNPAGKFIYVSPSCERISGYTPEEFYHNGKLMEKIIHPDQLKRWLNHKHNVLESGEHESLDFLIVARSGMEKWISHYCYTIYEKNGKPMGIRSSNDDITVRKQVEEALEKAARIDPLTGLLNRRAFMTRIKSEETRFSRNKRSFCLLMADIDHFKRINDTYGHDAGDYILRGLSRLMTDSLRLQDIIGRWGGEEFLILLPETDINGASFVAEKLRMAIQNHEFLYHEHQLTITVSFGISVYKDEMTIDRCLKRADDNLYLAKKQGRNRIVY